MALNDNYELLIGKIDTFIRKYYLNNLLRGVIFLGAGLLGAFVVITLVEYFGNFNTLLRSLLFYGFIILNLALIAWLIVPSLLAYLKLGKTISHDQAAQIIGQHFTDVKDKLLNTLQLKKLAEQDAAHRQLIEASISQKIDTLKPVSFPSAINIRGNNKYLKWVIFPAAIICVIAFAAPSVITESTRRLIRHNEHFAPVAPFQFIVLNQSLTAVQGDDFKLEIKLTGDKLPADVYLETGNNTFKLSKETISRFSYQFSNLQQNASFKLVANGFSSIPYEVKVNLRPTLLKFDAVLTYPAYLRKQNETVANAGDLSIPAGTVVKWQLHTQNADAVVFKMNGTNKQFAKVSNDVFEHSERINQNTSYTLTPLSGTVKSNEAAAYRINVIADELPSITVDEKQDSVSMNTLYFNGAIHDDHGFTSLTFNYRVAGANSEKVKSYIKHVGADLGGNQAGFFYFWNAKDLQVKPGEQIVYYFEVADNDAVTGLKRVRSAERTLKVPDEKQLNQQLNAATQGIRQKMQSALKLAGQLERETQKVNQLLLNKNSLSFDEKKQVQDLLQKRKDLDDLLKEIHDENKKNMYNRQENNKQDEQLTEMQKQVEQLLDNMQDKETKDLLDKLQQLLQKEQKDDTREGLNKMQQDNKSLKKELDRMMELYKKLDFEQKLDQNINQLNDLANKQQQLADKTKQPNADKNALQKEQQQLQQDFKEVKKSLDELQKSGADQDFKTPEKEANDIEQQMQNSAEELQKNNKQGASKSQQNAAEQMKQMAGKMQQQNDESESEETSVNAQQLRELLKNLVNSSFDQEKVMERLRGINPADPAYTGLAQKQKDIKDNLKTAEDSLYALSKRVPQIQSTVNKEITNINTYIDKSLELLGERRTLEAIRNEQYAMTSMNNLALMLNEALDQLQNAMKNGKAGKSKKGQQSISQLSRMQQQLNKNMQQMRDQMQQQGNEGKSGQQNRARASEQLARMARQQQQIRQQLEQINREDNKDGKGGLGDLDKISKEMEQTENDLVNRRVTDAAMKRQQQIQTRLLEAEKAEQQRDQDQQRESQAGKKVPPGYIKALKDYQQLRAKQTEQIRTVSPAINLYYKQKIKSYFDQLNAK